jgi:hypothetical protein
MLVLYWIFSTITGELQDIAKEHDVDARQVWHSIKHQFIGNSETRVLHLDATFRKFI